MLWPLALTQHLLMTSTHLHTLSTPPPMQFPLHQIDIKAASNEAELEVQSFIKWSEENRMNINFKKTWELLLRGKTTRITLLLSRIGLLIGIYTWMIYSIKPVVACIFLEFVNFTNTQPVIWIYFFSLILSVFLYAIEVWGSAFYDKYLSRIDKLFARSFKSGYLL